MGNYWSVKRTSIGLVATPLWKQDQLQEKMDKENTLALLMSFTDWVKKETDYCRESFEQLWLAFVMWELYQKKWSGSNWIY